MGLFSSQTVDVLTVGRIGVDIYPLQQGVGLEDVTSFGKFLGGSPTNVAVAAARMRHSAAVITAVGDDPFGRFCLREMGRLGVYGDYVLIVDDLNTPVTFCEIFPPDNFPLYFYRRPTAPDLQIKPADIPVDAVRNARVVWLTSTGLCQEPSRSAHLSLLEARGRRRHTILDLDYRAAFWPDAETAGAAVREVLPLVDVAIGNLEECRVATGETDPERAGEALLDAGVEIAVVKQGPRGVLAMTAQSCITVPASNIEVVNGLGAGDAFGGTFCHGLLRGWSLADTLVAASSAGALVATRLECSTAMPSEPELLEQLRRCPVAAVERAR
ncbi:MAG: 5-dehydro-2-deoxygluconokinase [Propionibacteriaceae bacterium]|nr:5-dehydro-2-deoxygluconokinase [Propionibacteriaceae bacterium]